jgi:hypothetical protein
MPHECIIVMHILLHRRGFVKLMRLCESRGRVRLEEYMADSV